MWHEITKFLVGNPLICLFISLSLGYIIGSWHFKTITLGSTVGSLLVALLIGQVGTFQIGADLKNMFFNFFIFVVGYEVGPAFLNSLKKSGIKLALQATFFSAVAFIVALTMFKVFKIGPGEAGGIIAGSLTQSSAIGTATSGIDALNLSAAEKALQTSNVAVAYAVTYVFGVIGALMFVNHVAPAILRINLKDETQKYIQAINFVDSDETPSPILSPLSARAFKIIKLPQANITVGTFEKQFNDKLVVQQIYENDKIQPLSDQAALNAGQVITVIGDSQDLLTMIDDTQLYQEVFDKQYLQLQLTTEEVMLTKAFNIHSLSSLVENNVVIVDVMRDGKKVTDLTTLRPYDRVTITGPKASVEKVMPQLGYKVADGQATDVSYLSLGLVVGLLIGTIILSIHGIPLTLGAGGGCLFGGIILGSYQSKHPQIGNIPSSTRWFLKSIGLNLFVTAVGLEAASQFTSAIKSMGPAVLIMGIVLTLTPHICTLLFGKYILKLNPIDNLGALAGSGTSTPSLNALNEQTGSSVFGLPYTPTFALGSIYITVMAPLMVSILSK